ncbi:MAG: hypothetical protein ABI164_10930, partial [Acidobacteriaceae bacterium]
MKPSPTDAAQEYARRLSAFLQTENRFERRSKLLGVSKLIAIALTLVAAAAIAKSHPEYIFVLAAPIAAIVLLFILHERVLRSLRRCLRLTSFYQRGIARIEDRWAGTGESGERFLDPAHPYARDQDLFGKGGIFELLSTARTRAGEETLAAWLLAPAAVEEILARQAAVAELCPNLDFRENLALAGEDFRVGVHPDALTAWSEQTARLNPTLARIAAPVLAILWVASLLAWALLGWAWAALIISLLNLAVTYRSRARVEQAAAVIENSLQELDLL